MSDDSIEDEPTASDDDEAGDEELAAVEDEANEKELEEVRRKWDGAVEEIFDRFDAALTLSLFCPSPGRAWQGPEPLTIEQLGVLDLFEANHNWSLRSEFEWWFHNTPYRGYLLGFEWSGGGPASNWSGSIDFLGPRPGTKRGYIYRPPEYEVEREWALLASVEPYDDPNVVGPVLARLLAIPGVAEDFYGELPDIIRVGNVVALSEEALTDIVNAMAELCGQTDFDLDFSEEDGVRIYF